MNNNVKISISQEVNQHPRKRKRPSWFKIIFTVIAFGVMIYLFWPLIGEIRNAAQLFLTIRWNWAILAIVTQVCSYAFLTGLNLALLRPFPGRIGFLRLMAVLPATAFIQIAIPSGGLSGVVLRTRLLGKNGYSSVASTVTMLLESIYLAAVMIFVSSAGVWYLINAGDLKTKQLVFAGVLIIVLFGGGAWIYRTGSDRQRGTALSLKVLNTWNRLLEKFKRPPQSTDDWLARLDEFYQGLAHLEKTPIWHFLFFSAGRVVLDVASLGLCFKAFDFAISPGILLTGYGMILVFSGMSTLPGGMALADVSLAVIYSRLGAPGAVSVAAALSYRLISFWMVRFTGFITWQFLEERKKISE
jgi:uncharacterized protein (TIRG00374 family)